MKKIALTLIISFTSLFIFSQNLHIQTFAGIGRTNFKLNRFSNNSGFLTTGIRIAGGLNKIQIGAEIENNLINPFFLFDNSRFEEEIENKYRGCFLRINISSLPAYRFGLILKGGAGVHQTTFNRNFGENPELNISQKFENSIGYHGGIGFSTPIKDRFHFDFNYQYNWTERKELSLGLKKLTAHHGGYHSFQFGLSYNFVLGKAKKEAEDIIQKRPW